MRICNSCKKRVVCWLPCHEKEMELLRNSRKLARPYLRIVAFNARTNLDGDFICDGKDDQIEINAAIRTMGDRRLDFGNGIFNIHGSIIGKVRKE